MNLKDSLQMTMEHREIQLYDPNTEIPHFSCGIRFIDQCQFKHAVAKYSIKKCCDLRFIQNDSTGVRYRCEDQCKWEIFASIAGGDQSFTIKTYDSKHSFIKEYDSKLAIAGYLANYFRPRIMENLTITLLSHSTTPSRLLDACL